ncbi:acyl-CoA dehydrogenase [Nevskia ramosa]|uniref:acyl-CoA dehydrogenase n=1 Tax=Nevskia ramosa TaxID=64002 RepID=UPI003D0A9A5C
MSGTTSLLLSRRDLEFMLYEWLDVEALTKAPRFADHSRETFDAVLDTFERIATDLFEPHYQKSDREEPQFIDGKARLIPEIATALKAVAESGLMAAGHDYDRGGMQLPSVIERTGMAYLQAANVGTAAYPFLSIANANLLVALGSEEQIKRFAEPTLKGEFFGTMCLSEPQAGSSLSDIKTRAEFEAESELGLQYRLTGSKMWISAGEHEITRNIVHLVLARTVDESGASIPGVKGLSLFIVPKFVVNADGSDGERNDVVLGGLNHKMGYRGTTNCLLNFGEGREHQPGGRAGAIGYRIGEAGKGMSYMFHMMNEARIGVGLGATALGYTGYLHSRKYAQERLQGRSLKDPSTPQQRISDHADVKRMILAQKVYAEGAMALNMYCSVLIDQMSTSEDEAEKKRQHLLLEILTPIAKSWPSQWCVVGNDMAIQIHGGYGYTREFKVEQFYRDNRLNPIHEGTHGIQGLDLLGRKVVMENGTALVLLTQRIGQSIAKARESANAELHPMAEALSEQMQRLAQVTRILLDCEDPAQRLANATAYLEAFGHIVLAWIWLDQALACGDSQSPFHRAKRNACKFFFVYELPRIEPQLALLERLDRITLDASEDML